MTKAPHRPSPPDTPEASQETSKDAASSQDLHPRPNIRRIGRVGAALTMILFLVGLTVLTFKYSPETVTREPRESVQTATRPLGPDQIAQLRPPEPPPEPPDLSIPEPGPEESRLGQAHRVRYRPSRRATRSRQSFGVRRPAGSRRIGAQGSNLPGSDAGAGARNQAPYLSEEALAQALRQVPPAPRPGATPEPAHRGTPEPRRFAASEVDAVRVDYDQPLTRYEIKEGSYLPALLTHALSSELAGPVRAQVSRDVYDSIAHRHLLIPRGTTLLGSQIRQPVAGERRVPIVWDRLVLPDGRSVDLASGELAPLPSASADGTLGLLGKVNRHWPRRLGTAALVSLVGAGVQLSQPQRSATGLNAASPEQLAAGELGLNLGRLSERVLNRTIDQPPTIELSAGTRVFVWITRDLAFPNPYKR